MEIDNYIRGVTSSPEVKQLVTALALAQMEYKPIKKTGRNEYGKFDYSTLGDICVALLPSLNKHGFPMPLFQTGYMGGELVMVGKLVHKTGEWVSCVLPMRDMIDKNGNRREDNQSLEAASTYTKKQLFLQLAGGWSVGAEDLEQAEEAHSQVNAEVAKEKEPPAPAKATTAKAQDFFKRLETRMKMVRSVPGELVKCFQQAESLIASGDLTADQMAKLTRQFGALLPKKEVADAH
jgi:hypothetical protein